MNREDELRAVATDFLDQAVRLKEALRVARGALQAILDCEERGNWVAHAERKAAAAIEDIDRTLQP